MKRKIMMLVCFVVFMAPRISFATPPESLELSYNKDSGILTAQGPHPTQDRFEHYIRRVVVTRNQDEPQKFYVTRQDSASQFKFDVPFKAEPGDKLHVEVFCSQGGTKAADLDIPKTVQKSQEPSMPAEQLKAMKDKEHQTLPIIP